jgi:NDP-sugar pyrophosphorylase family protein
VKALILAAGKSSRLGELGAHLPKPMLPLQGRPVLEWTIERLRSSGVSDLLINLHHAPAVIRHHFGDGSGWGVRITYLLEEQILGTAGAVRNAWDVLIDDTFLVVYGDTVLDWDPEPMLLEHRKLRPLGTIAVAEVEDPSQLGVVCFDEQRRIQMFVEKPGPRRELGRWVNAGLLVFEPSVFEYIPAGCSDFGRDVLPTILGRGGSLRAYPRPRPLVLIDTPDQYHRAEQTWAGAADSRAQ